MKIWTVRTDTKFGTECHTFCTQEGYDEFMHDFLADYWDKDLKGVMPENWGDAWEAMEGGLPDCDSFTTDEQDLFDHPMVHEMLSTLSMARDRLGLKNCGGDENDFIQELEALIAQLSKPQESAIAA